MKSFFVITREYKTIFPFYFLIMGINTGNYGILKVAYPDGQQPLIGRDWSASISAAFCEASYFFGFYFYLYVILAFLEGYSRMMTSERRMKMAERFRLLVFTAWFVPPVGVLMSILLLISIRYPAQSRELGATRLVIDGLTFMLSALILCNALIFLINELNGVKKSKDLSIIITRLYMAYYGIGGACLGFGALHVAFACSPFLFQMSTYIILITYTCVPPVMLALVLTVSGISKNDSRQVVPTASAPPSPITTPAVSLIDERRSTIPSNITDRITDGRRTSNITVQHLRLNSLTAIEHNQ